MNTKNMCKFVLDSSVGTMNTTNFVYERLVPHSGEMQLSDILRKMTLNPANILRISGGRLAVGGEADLTIFDPDEEWVIDPEQFASKGRNTPFAGRTVKGKVKYTVVSGKVIYQDQ